jgi:putative pyruvate formate lyase activating enzyme
MIFDEFLKCNICPRNCNVNRYENAGFCKSSERVKVSKVFVHMWEEPCISGDRGSGTVFFSNCSLRCVYCQNYKISSEGFGIEISLERLSEIFIELQNKNVHNINLVTPTHYIPIVREALKISKSSGLNKPVIYNSSGYENVGSLKTMEGLIDVYLPDIKYYDGKYSIKYSKAPDYFKFASEAVLEMYRQVGAPEFDDHGIIKRGVMVRHLMLPGLLFDSKKIVDWVIGSLPDGVYLNLMCQYTPMNRADEFPELNRKINRAHYEALVDYAVEHGLVNGFIQEFDSADEEYVPDFNLDGV